MVMDMWEPNELTLLGLFLLIICLTIPSLHYIFAISSVGNLKIPKEHNFFPHLTLFLPMRNESSNVRRKINEALSVDYPEEKLRIVVMDSSSDDDTASQAIGLLGTRGDVIPIEKPGKSLAMNNALEIVDTDFFVMMDADAICPPDSISKLIQWFADPNIGAVCGLQSDEFSDSDPYRKRFNTLRVGESALDSTPIFEGSLCCFRTEAIGDRRLNIRINADDSQLAMISRENGFKSIMDPSITFSESEPISRSRKVRRAQGLCRALISQKKMCYGRGRYSIILSSIIFFYVIMPWLFLSSVIFLGISFFVGEQISLEAISSPQYMIPAAASAVLSISSMGRNFLSGIFILIESHLRLIVGNTLEVWDPDR